MIKRLLFDFSRTDSRVKIFLSLIGLVSEEDITLVEIILIVHFGKVQIVADNIFRFLKNIIGYISEPDYEVINIWHSDERELLVDNPVYVDSNTLINYLMLSEASSVIENVRSLMNQRLVYSGYELFRRRFSRAHSSYILNQREWA